LAEIQSRNTWRHQRTYIISLESRDGVIDNFIHNRDL